MKKPILLILFFSFILFSCGEDADTIIVPDEDSIEGKSSSTITGAVSKSLDGGATFVHTFSSIATTSAIQIYLINSLNEDEVIDLRIFDVLNGTGITPGTYSYNPDPSTTKGFIGLYLGEEVIYTVNEDLKNEITITSVIEKEIVGEFEINLVEPLALDPSIATIKIVGTFEAVGETFSN